MKVQGLFQSLGIRARVLVLAVLPVASVVALLGYNLASSRLEDAERNLAERGELIARNLALASEFALFSQNMPLVDDTLQRVAKEPDVRWSAVWDAQREAMISRGEGPSEAGVRVLLEAMERGQGLPPGYHFVPISVELVALTDFSEEYGTPPESPGERSGQHLGYAIVEIAPDQILKRRAAIVRNSTLVTLSGLVVSVLLALLIGNSITDPVLALLSAVRALQAGNLGARVRVRAGGEIGSLEQGVNRMAEALQKSQETLQQRVEESTQALRRTVAELEARNRELDQAREVAQRAGQERTEFLARMSHEIRTPLNAVVGFTKLLDPQDGGPSNVEHVRTIQRAAEQLLHVINDILQFIRLDAGADRLEWLPFDLADVLEDVVAMLGPMANEKGLELVLLLHGDLPQSLEGDAARLSQVVVNLVNNAIKFTAEGQVAIEASRRCDDAGAEQIEIVVKDSGIGLDAAEQERLFSAFTQGDSSITRRFGGTGLGLAIARRLVELMGGRIGAEGSKGEGARFWVRLPCRGCSPPAPIELGGPLAGQRVLVYDVNPLTRRSLRSMLAAWDVEVFNTGRWRQVLELLASSEPAFDTVIVGLSSKERQPDCVERYLTQLRAHHPGLVLLLTGSENWEPSEALRAAPRLAWATKPLRRATLRRLLSDRPTGDKAPPIAAERPRRLLGMQVLVAEDNAFNRQLLRHVLEEEGASLDEAVSGSAAVAAAVRGGYDVILMDLHMPEIDGAEAACLIRSSLGSGAPPILALTADVFGRSDPKRAEAGFDDWLLKPIDPELLVDRLVGLWQRDRAAAVEGPVAPARLPPELCRRFRREIADLGVQLRAALDDPDPSKAAAPLHDLKGIAGLFGDPRQTELVERLCSEFFSADRQTLLGLLDALQQCTERDGEVEVGPTA